METFSKEFCKTPPRFHPLLVSFLILSVKFASFTKKLYICISNIRFLQMVFVEDRKLYEKNLNKLFFFFFYFNISK